MTLYLNKALYILAIEIRRVNRNLCGWDPRRCCVADINPLFKTFCITWAETRDLDMLWYYYYVRYSWIKILQYTHRIQSILVVKLTYTSTLMVSPCYFTHSECSIKNWRRFLPVILLYNIYCNICVWNLIKLNK